MTSWRGFENLGQTDHRHTECSQIKSREICQFSLYGRNFVVVVDIKKEIYDDKYINDANEINLNEARHHKKLTVDDV
jgi:hypothetical protein